MRNLILAIVASIVGSMLLMANISYAATTTSPASTASYAATALVGTPQVPTEIIIGVGQTVANSYRDQKSPIFSAFSLAFRKRLSPRFDASVMYLDEGNPADWPKRDGIAVEGWYNVFSMNRLRFSVGVGPYAYYSTVLNRVNSFRDEHGIDLLISLDIRYAVSEHGAIHVDWHRVTTWNNRNANVFQVGFGWHL